jgi:hypothetical protein
VYQYLPSGTQTDIHKQTHNKKASVGSKTFRVARLLLCTYSLREPFRFIFRQADKTAKHLEVVKSECNLRSSFECHW